MRGLRCLLAAGMPGEGPGLPAAHRRHCPGCREAAARDAAVRQSLAALAAEVAAAPAGLEEDVLSRLGDQDAADPRRALVARAAARYAALGGLAVAALVALAAGLARRHSRALG